MAFLGGLFGGNREGGRAGLDANKAAWNAAGLAGGEYWGGEGRALGQFDKNYYDPYSLSGDEANAMYANALGLRGPEGNAAATGAFQAGPGYNFALGQGIQALDRSAAGSGMFGSGNAAMALSDYGRGMANQEYGNWLSRLGGLGAQGLTAAGGQTGRQGNLANINMWGAGGRAKAVMDAGLFGAKAQQEGRIADVNANRLGSENLFNAILGGLSLFRPKPA